jgi:hypothetical protein
MKTLQTSGHNCIKCGLRNTGIDEFLCNDCVIANCDHEWIPGQEAIAYEHDSRFCTKCFHLESPGFNKYRKKL